MKNVLKIALIAFLCVCYQQTNAQIVIQKVNGIYLNAQDLEAQKTVIKTKEKEKLKAEVQAINKQLKAGEITVAEAEQLKKEAAEKHAQNIEDQLDIIDANIALLKRNESQDSVYYQNLKYLNVEPDDEVVEDEPDRTVSYTMVAAGFNNAIGSGQSLDESPYKIGGSRFFEIGYMFSTALVKSGFLRVNYGLKLQFNGLKVTDNRYFVEQGEQTVLKKHAYDLKKAKLRMDNLVLPVHFEIGSTNKYYWPKKFKFGLGGYAGINLNTIQKLKFEKNSDHKKYKITDDYNTSNFLYGLSTYIGYDRITLYVKYGLNPLFQNNPVEVHNVSAGLRYIF